MRHSVFLGTVMTALLLTACSDKASTDKTDSEHSVALAENGDLCTTFGPQTPRDIASAAGLNTMSFPMAPAASSLNLCNIHTHTNAEHKGPGFSVFVNDSDNGGYACNDSDSLTEAELSAPVASEFG